MGAAREKAYEVDTQHAQLKADAATEKDAAVAAALDDATKTHKKKQKAQKAELKSLESKYNKVYHENQRYDREIPLLKNDAATIAALKCKRWTKRLKDQ